MTVIKKTKIDDLPDFDPADYLRNNEDIAAYLTLVMAENNPAELATALGTVSRARGMAEIAEASGMTREALYKALRPGSSPRFETISRVICALGLHMEVRA